MDYSKLIASPGKKIHLANYDTSYTGHFKKKKEAVHKLENDIEQQQTW